MNFLNPFLLVALVAVAVPIIIHLINLRRPRKVSFSTLSFFNELRKSTIRRIRIKQYLLMALRALALLLLALALARPFLPPTLTGSTSSGEPKAVAILIDNSASMSRIGSQGPLVDQAKEIAVRIIQNANSDNKFFISTTNSGNNIPDEAVEAERATEIVSEITAQNTAHYTKEQFEAAYNRLQDIPESQAVMYIISDAQQSQLSDLENVSIGNDGNKAVSVQLVRLQQGEQQNLAISSISLKNQIVAQGRPVTLGVEVENVGDVSAVNQFVSLEVSGEVSGQYEVELEPGEKEEFLFEIVPEEVGSLSGRIFLEGDEIDYDNQQFFVLRIPETRSILLVNEAKTSSAFTSYLRPVLDAAQQTNAQLSFSEQQPSEVDPSRWGNYDAIIFDGLEGIPDYWFQDLQRFVQDGKGIFFLPSEQGEVGNYNRFFSLFNAGEFINVMGEYGSFEPVVKMAELEEGHPILDEVFTKKEDEEINIDLSSLFYYYRYENPNNSGAFDILKAANGDPLLTEQKFGDGVFLVSTLGTDPGWSNLSINAVFAPLFYRSMLYVSLSESVGLQQHTLGTIFEWELPSQYSDVTLEINESEYKPETRRQSNGLVVSYEGREWEPGIIVVKADEEIMQVAVNQNIMESRFATLTSEKWQEISADNFEVTEMLSGHSLSADDLEERLSASMFGQEVWNWFVWIALFFLITETAVSRLYKAESIS